MNQKEIIEVLPAPRQEVNWGNASFLLISHVAAIAVLFFWSWPAVISAIILYWVAGSLGIGMGFHRLITHRGYKVPQLVEYFAYPTSARHGLRWYELDFNWLGILALQLAGVAHAVKRVRFSRSNSTWQLVRDGAKSEVIERECWYPKEVNC